MIFAITVEPCFILADNNARYTFVSGDTVSIVDDWGHKYKGTIVSISDDGYGFELGALDKHTQFIDFSYIKSFNVNGKIIDKIEQ